MAPRRTVVVVAAATMFAASLVACSSGSKSSNAGSGGGSSSTSSGTPISVKMEVLVSSLGTALHGIAEKRNTYAANGLNVIVESVNSGNETVAVQQLVQGRAEFAFVTSPAVATLDSAYVAKGQAAPLKVVAATANVSNVVLGSKVPYTDLNSLKGLKLGISSLTSDHRINLDYYLGQHGTNADQLGINFVAVPASDMPAALASGQIDGFVHSEPTTALAITQDHAHLAFSMGGEIQTKATSVLAVRTDYLKSNSDTIKRMVAALQQATKDYATMAEPDVVAVYASFIKSTPALMTQVYEQKDYNPGLEPLRTAADSFWKVALPSMKSQKLVTESLTQDDMFDYSYS